MSYDAFAKRLRLSGIITDPWLEGAPRFREDPLVLPADLAAAMYRCAERVAETYHELCLLVSESPEILDTFFGLSPFQKAMWLASEPLWHGLARADVFVTDEGLAIAELNCDTPTGEAEAIVLGAMLAEDGKVAEGLVDPNAGLGERFVRMVEMLARDVPTAESGKRAAIVYPTELPEDLSLVRLYKRLFEARGWEIVLGSPYNLTYGDEGLSLFGQPVSLVLRHYKTDWWGERASAWKDEDLPDSEPLTEALSHLLRAMLDGRVAVVNPFGSVLPQNKRSMAFMWEHIHRFSRRAQETIRAHVPVTRRLESVPREQLLAERADWVLKSDYGAEGDEVVIGKLATDASWRASLEQAREGSWIAQRYFQAQEGAGGEIVNHGVFLVAGEAAGLYARIQVGATDERALSTPVLVER